MSGNVPAYISKGAYALLNGKPAKVTDFYFTSSAAPRVPNTDSLFIRFEGDRQVRFFEDGNKVEPITEGKKPDFIEIGRAVLFNRDFAPGTPRKIERLFYMTETLADAQAPTEKDLMVGIEGYVPMRYARGKFRPVPELAPA